MGTTAFQIKIEFSGNLRIQSFIREIKALPAYLSSSNLVLCLPNSPTTYLAFLYMYTIKCKLSNYALSA